MNPASVVVVVAHGSRAPAANAAHRDVVAELDDRSSATVVAAFLELADPSIDAAIDAAAATGAPRVVVLPHFLYPGRHLTTDIPAIVAAAAERHPGVSMHLLPASGADPRVLTLLAAQVAGAVGDDRPHAADPA